MQEFIQAVMSQLGVNENQAQSATGGLLQFLKNQADGNEVHTLISKLPGAEDLMKSVGSGSPGGGGLLGGLGAAIGGTAGGSAGLLSLLQGSGLGGGTAGSFVKMFVDYAKQKAGPDLVEQVLAKVPALKSLM